MSSDSHSPAELRRQSLLTRIQGMSGDELRTRAKQELAKRTDVLRDALRLRPAAPARSGASAGVFYFDRSGIARIVKQIQSGSQAEAQALEERAKRLAAGRFDLLGYRDLDFGDPINWSLDPVSGREAPARRWPSVPYLDYSVVGDHKVTWELSRHQHVLAMVRAWRLTGKKQYVDVALRRLESWFKDNAYPIGINWTSALEVAFRALSWIWIERLLDEREHREIRERLLDGIGISGRYLERFLSTYFSPNTHLLGEAFALYAIGTALPAFQTAARWRDLGRQVVLAEAEKQVRADGMYFEQSIYYHVYTIDFLIHFKILNERAKTPVPAVLDQTIERMCSLLAAVSQGGVPPRFGDDDGGRLFDGARNRAEHLLDPLATAAVLFDKPEWKALAPLTEEACWLLGVDGVNRYERLKSGERKPRSVRHDEGGLHVMASDENPPRALVVDAGPLGALRAGHGHADQLSLVWSQGGREWLTDPGACRYPAETPERDKFRGTQAHSTMTVDEADQAEPAGSFAWEKWPQTRTELFAAGRRADAFVGSHEGYRRLASPVTHRRTVVQFKDGVCFVRDEAQGRGRHTLDVIWRPAAGFRLAGLSDERLTLVDGARRLQFLAPRSEVWRREVFEDEVSPAYGALESAPVVQYRAETETPAELGVFLVAGEGCDDAEPTVTMKRSDGAASRYDLEMAGRRTTVWLGASDEWEMDGWKTDARILCRRESEGGSEVIAVRATRLEWRKKSFFTAERPVDLYECWSEKGELQVRTSGSATARSTATLKTLNAVEMAR